MRSGVAPTMAWMCPSSMMSPDTYPYHPSQSRTSGLGWQRAGPSDSLWSWVPCGPGSALPPIQVSADKKQTGSTVGMQTSVETSTLLKVGLLGTGETRALPPRWVCRVRSRMQQARSGSPGGWVGGSRGPGPRPIARECARPHTHPPTLQFRAESVVPERMKEMTRCIQEQDFQGFAQLTMKDSNQFHATCLDTFPPISYLNDTSRRIIQLVHRFNTHQGQTKVTGRGGRCRHTEGRLWGTWAATAAAAAAASAPSHRCSHQHY